MLPFFLTLALDAASPALPPAGTYRYDATVAGAKAGGATLNVTGKAGGLSIAERATGASDDSDVAIDDVLELDASLMPVAYRAAYKVHDRVLDHMQQMQVAVSFATRAASVAAGGDVREFALGGTSKAFVILDSSAVAGFFVLPAQMRAFGGADTTVLVPGLGAEKFLNVIPGDKPARPAGLPAADVSISFAGQAPFVEWYDPLTLVPDRIDVPGASLTLARTK